LSNALELYESRVSRIDLGDDMATIHFSHAYIHKTKGKPGQGAGTAWSQEAQLVMSDPVMFGPMPGLPGTITEGYLEVGGVRHELLPLPFARKVAARLWLVFEDGTQAEIAGKRPFVELLGKPIYLEDSP
jgi:hypothetical protein